MKILITGATGYIGAVAAEALGTRGQTRRRAEHRQRWRGERGPSRLRPRR